MDNQVWEIVRQTITQMLDASMSSENIRRNTLKHVQKAHSRDTPGL